MNITYLRVLGILRELYLERRDMARFRRYIATMTGGGDDIVLPIGVANPMAKDHALAKLRLIRLRSLSRAPIHIFACFIHS
jgi:hypothetical protein